MYELQIQYAIAGIIKMCNTLLLNQWQQQQTGSMISIKGSIKISLKTKTNHQHIRASCYLIGVTSSVI